MDTFELVGNRYQVLGKIGEGGMGVVFRANDRLTKEVVALKKVTRETDQLVFNSRNEKLDAQLALAHEFRTLASMRHPNIISVLDYGFDKQSQPYFTMTYLEKGAEVTEAGHQLPLEQQIRYVMEMLQALAYLHRRGIIHRDMKPGNVLVCEGQVKVLDFGLAVERKARKETEGLLGTLAYMAPELYRDEAVTEKSDLYAVGLMTYEMITGEMPFDTSNVSRMIVEIATKPVDVFATNIPDPLKPILARMLTHSLEARYASAAEAMDDLAEAFGQSVMGESLAVRESFLQAADFVGREAEIKQLSDVLAQAKESQGSIVMVGGESGVGKSRLLEELRVLAVTQGVPVLRGQAISEGSFPYHMWRTALRELVLFVELNPFEASVLKSLVPDIADLLGAPVDDAPEVDPQAARDRMLGVIENVLVRQEQPLALILEDLHWAGAESMNILVHLTQVIGKTPVLVIGSYRDDESPRLPETVPGSQVISLKRLNEQNIARLSVSMLGGIGERPYLVDFLQRETEGNVFFLVEVVRALAEEFGNMEKIGVTTLPEHVFAGGVDRMVRRRLERVPDEYQALLGYAALLGREIDEKALQAIAPQVDIEKWLTACSEAAVLDVQDNRWRFAHDKLREGLLRNLPENERPQLHRTVAEGIEKAYPDDVASHVAALAYHWEQAQVADKAVYYLEKAGEQALNSSAYDGAISLIRRAMALDPGKDVERDPLRYARRSRLLGEAYYNIGRLVDSGKYLEEALQYLGLAVPAQKWRVGLSLGGQLMSQTMHRLMPGVFLGRRKQAPHLMEAMEAVRMLTSVQFIGGDLLRWAYVTVRWLNTAEAGQQSPEVLHALSFIYAIMSTITGSVPFHAAARTYKKLALDGVAAAPEPAQAVVWNYAGIYTLGIADWSSTEDMLVKSRRIYENMGHPRRWEELTIFLAFLNYYRGTFAEAYQLWEDNYASAFRRGDTQMQYPALIGRAQCVMRMSPLEEVGEAGEFLARIDDFLFDPARQTNNAERSNYYALQAAYKLRRGLYDDAWKSAQEALEVTRQLSTEVKVLVQEPYDRLPEFFVTLWRIDRQQDLLPQDKRDQLPALLAESCHLVHGYAKVIVFAQPRAWLWQGWYHSLRGERDKANEAWQKSLRLAQRLQMPYDQGRALFAIGTNGGGAELKQAAEIFRQQGIRYNFEQADKVLP